MKGTLPDRARFGVFELDLKAGELHKNGKTVLLQEQPFQVLRMLVVGGGELVTREAIQKKLWPNDTVVEFDHGINTAIQKLRQVLGDSADRPSYIQTVARRGYRLVAPVEWVGVSGGDKPSSSDYGNRRDAAPTELKSQASALAGTKVSHYRVLEILGGGGMGVVYRAEDLKLGRAVALKFLAKELATDSLTLQRFERETRTASALNHPNICTIYEVGEHEGQPFMVMELLEGETLRELIAKTGASSEGKRSQLPTQRLLDIILQIADGLDAAHQKGIIHRDIKPANIFVTAQGQVKILDFGLAKLAMTAAGVAAGELCEDGAHGTQPEAKPGAAIAHSLTQTGKAMGTAGYMSPEQVRGDKLDPRTDLFSFGLVLYEMATGHRAFGGDTAPILHDAILKRAPAPMRELNPGLPPKLEAITSKALEKDRELRYQHASEIRADLKRLQQEAATRLRGWTIAVAGALAVAAMTGMWWFEPHHLALPDLKVRQLTNNRSDNPVRTGAISPDGKYLAYADLKGIHAKLLDTGRTQSIPRPEALKGNPLEWEIVQWLPDSTSFLANLSPPSERYLDQHSSIWKFSIAGAPPRKLRDDAEGWSVSPDGHLVFFGANPGGFGKREIWQMGPDGEQPLKLFESDENSAMIGVQWLEGGHRLGYLKLDKSGLAYQSRDLRGGLPTTALSTTENSSPSGLWLPDGRIFNVLMEPSPNDYSCNIWGMRADIQTGELAEPPKRITNWTGFCIDVESVTADGKRLTFMEWAGEGTIDLADFQSRGARITSPTHLPRIGSNSRVSAWTDDSKAVIFLSKRNGQWGIFRQLLNDYTAETIVASLPGYPLFTKGNLLAVPRTSPDGRLVLYAIYDKYPIGLEHGYGSATLMQLMRVPVDGGRPQLVLRGHLYGPPSCARSPATVCAIAEQTQDLKQLIFTGFDPLQGRGRELTRLQIDPSADYQWAISPDGTRIAVSSNREGRINILHLGGLRPERLTVKGWSSLDRIAWAANTNGLFVSSLAPDSSVLLYVDLRSNAHVLWKQEGGVATWGIPSPDGRHLAIENWTLNSNIWMMENF
jgi:serine/threonine protein kinase